LKGLPLPEEKATSFMSFQNQTQGQHATRTGSEPATIIFPVRVNSLLYIGLEKILSEHGFIVWPGTCDNLSSLPDLQDQTSFLFIVDGNNCSDGAVSLIKRLKAQCPTARLVVLADHFEPSTVLAAWEAGADGFCLSTQHHEILVKSLELVMLGELVMPATLAFALAAQGGGPSDYPLDASPSHADPDGPVRPLSNRELEILNCLREGAPNKVIARKLKLSEATVKVHVKAILKKIGACNRTQAALWARKHNGRMPETASAHAESNF
jgi:two-component system nitrate/nitrite response regulator NarL